MKTDHSMYNIDFYLQNNKLVLLTINNNFFRLFLTRNHIWYMKFKNLLSQDKKVLF